MHLKHTNSVLAWSIWYEQYHVTHFMSHETYLTMSKSAIRLSIILAYAASML